MEAYSYHAQYGNTLPPPAYTPRKTETLYGNGHTSQFLVREPKAAPSLFNRVANWCNDHKKQILIALLIIGAAALTLGVGLAVGAACSSSLIGVKLVGWGWWMKATAVYTPAAKLFLAGAIAMFCGATTMSFSAGALLNRK